MRNRTYLYAAFFWWAIALIGIGCMVTMNGSGLWVKEAHHIPYVADPPGVDIWDLPYDTERKGGDCEDKTIFCMDYVRTQGRCQRWC